MILLTLKMDYKMKRYLLSPFFTPICFLLLWALPLITILTFESDKLYDFLEEGGIIENTTHSCYLVLLVSFMGVSAFFWKQGKQGRINFVLLFLLGVSAFLREMGIQHWIPSQDTTAFKSRFFLNPNNPLDEKILAGFLLILLLMIVVYLAVKYAKHLIVSFFQLNPVTWSIATLCTLGVVSKFIDRFPSNFKKSYGGPMDESIRLHLEMIEETSEIFLPLIAAFCLWQYCLYQKKSRN